MKGQCVNGRKRKRELLSLKPYVTEGALDPGHGEMRQGELKAYSLLPMICRERFRKADGQLLPVTRHVPFILKPSVAQQYHDWYTQLPSKTCSTGRNSRLKELLRQDKSQRLGRSQRMLEK